jgi:hypothetical protein
MLGYPEAAQKDADDAVNSAREIGHGATLILALIYKATNHLQSGAYAKANVCIDQFLALAEESGALFWRVVGGWYEVGFLHKPATLRKRFR